MTRELTTYRLWRQINGRGAFAEVAVSAASIGQEPRQVTVADGVSPCDAYGAAAIEGVHFALDHALPVVEASISIERIDVTLADSSAEAVRFAAAHATWLALGVQPTRALEIYGVAVSA